MKKEIEILKPYDVLQKCGRKEVALKHDVSQTTLYNLLKEKKLFFYDIACNQNPPRKGIHEGKSNEIECALCEWFNITRAQNVQTSRKYLPEIAKQFAEMFHEGFIPTDGVKEDRKSETILLLESCIVNNTRIIFKHQITREILTGFLKIM